MNKQIQTENAPKAIGPYSQAIQSGSLLFGYTVDDVVKTTCFLSDINNFAAFNEVYGNYFTSKPARSCMAVKDLPKAALVEVEVIANK